MKRLASCITAFIAALTFSAPALAADLYIAAASDLIYCLDELNAAFKLANPDATLKVSTGSSGVFFAQIQNGAPYEIYMSADLAYPRKLVAAAHADGKTLVNYAVGRIALWTIDAQLDLSSGLQALKNPRIKHLAIANPAHAPYGQAAQAALQHAGLWEAMQPKLVMGENISQTAQFVQTGNAEAGIVAYSLLKAPKLAGVGRYALIPLAYFPAMEQGAVVTTKGATNPLAKKYIAFLASRQARAIFDRYGFLQPGAAPP